MHKNVLVTGGTGYIGSHTVVALIEAGYQPILVDNLSNSNIKTLDQIKKITGKKDIPFYQIDLCDQEQLSIVVQNHKIDAVIHFAGLKAVGESVAKPILYFENNIGGAISLINMMQKANINRIIFSSSATVYGVPDSLPLSEDSKIEAINPYGTTKVVIEQLLNDMAKYQNWKVINLRYFNPVGAHSSGLIGEEPNGIPNNLVPYLCQVAAGIREKLYIFGKDYPTPDGTCIRDYIHVTDLASAHVRALQNIDSIDTNRTYNLGTGKGYSVLELIQTFIKANKVTIAYEFTKRRSGDPASCYSNPDLAFKELGWKAKLDLKQMLIDAWQFTKKCN